MLLYLYNFFENLLITTIGDLYRIDVRNLTAFKCLILIFTFCVAGICIIYSLKSLSSHIGTWIDNLLDWKSLGILGWSRFIVKSFNELKFSLAILIAVLVGFGLVYNQYINRHNAGIADIIVIPIDIFDHEVNVNADLNMNDRQNVHNGTVSKHVIEAVKKLVEKEKQNKIKPQPYNEIYREIREHLMGWTHPSVGTALDVLDQIHNLNAHHVGTNLTEMEILRLVWQRIKHPINEQQCNDLKESLAIQLIDCKPNGGSIMCITGRITRILQTLECIDAENIVDLKPLWAIKEHIADYCGRYSDKLLDRSPQKYKDAYNALKRNPDQDKLVEKYNRCLRVNLDKKFKLMYLDTNILTNKQLNELTKTYYDNFQNL